MFTGVGACRSPPACIMDMVRHAQGDVCWLVAPKLCRLHTPVLFTLSLTTWIKMSRRVLSMPFGVLRHSEEPAPHKSSPGHTEIIHGCSLWISITETEHLKVYSQSACPPPLRVQSRASSHSAGSSPTSSCSWICVCAGAAAATGPAPRTCYLTRCAASSTSCTCRR